MENVFISKSENNFNRPFLIPEWIQQYQWMRIGKVSSVILEKLKFLLLELMGENEDFIRKGSTFNICSPLSEAWLVAQGSLQIGMIYILLSNDLQGGMKFWD